MIDRPTLLRLAAEAYCDPRTAEKALDGKPIAGMVGERLRRIIAAWRASGVLPPATDAPTEKVG